MRNPWPACWVHFEAALEPPRMCSGWAWAQMFPPCLEEDAPCCPRSNGISAPTITNPTTPPACSAGASRGEGDPA